MIELLQTPHENVVEETVSVKLEKRDMDTDMMQELRDLMDGPLKSGPIELVDSLIKDGMNLAYKQLMHVKDCFKKDPKSFNSDEMNIKILYKEKVDRDNKLKLNED